MKLDVDDPYTRDVLAAGARRSHAILDMLAEGKHPSDIDTLIGLLLVAVTLDVAAEKKGAKMPPFGELCGFLRATYCRAQSYARANPEVRERAEREARAREPEVGEPIPDIEEIEAFKRMGEMAVKFVPAVVDAVRAAVRAQRVPIELVSLVALETAVVFAKLRYPNGPTPMHESAWEMATTMLWNGVEVESLTVPVAPGGEA